MKKKSINLFALIIAFILGVALYKHFNFDSMAFEKPWLDALYLVSFIGSLYLIFKKKGSRDIG